MATETGTATDYKDLLQKLKLFLTGQSVSPIGSNGLNWVVEEERSASTSPQTDITSNGVDSLIETAANNNQNHDQIIFRGTGGTSPEKEIYFAIQTLGLSTTGYYNWQIRGLTGFATSSPQYVKLADQPGLSPPCYILLQNTTMTYWFIANNRRVMGCVKTGSSYQLFYIGFLNPYATDAEYPYPMCVFGTSDVESDLFSSTVTRVSSFVHPGSSSNSRDSLPTTGVPFPSDRGNGYVRFVDGFWWPVKNFSGDGTESIFIDGQAIFHVYPQAGGTPTHVPDPQEINRWDEWSQFRSTISGSTPGKEVIRGFGSPEYTTLWPLTIIGMESEQIVGDLDGCYWCPQAGGITSEDTITDFGESPEVEHLIFQSVWRTDRSSFMAMRNE